MGNNNIIFYYSPVEDTLSSAEAWMHHNTANNRPVKSFRLPYTPPFQSFTAIREVQSLLRYRPFIDPPDKDCLLIIDLSEWENHEKEEYIAMFFKFLSDYPKQSYFQPSYVFSLKASNRCEGFHKLAGRIFPGHLTVIEDKTLVNRQELMLFLSENFPLDKKVSDTLATILAGRVESYSDLRRIIDDLLIDIKAREFLTERKLVNVLEKHSTKLELFFEAEVKTLLSEYKEKHNNDRRSVA